MTCALGREALEAAQLDEIAPWCACEACAASDFGPVKIDEQLIRFIVPPSHWDKAKARPKAAALSHAQTSGMSVFREKFVTDQELMINAAALVDRRREADPTHGLMGILVFSAEKVKRLFGEARSPYCIYDTALPLLPSHSDIFQRVHAANDDEQLIRRRALFSAVQDGFVKLSDFRQGLLLPWAAATAP